MNRAERLSNPKQMKHVLARAIVCSMVLALPSCGIPPLRLTQPGPCLPPTFNGVANPQNSAQLGVKEFYNDPILTGLIEQALAGNRELLSLNEEIQVAGSLVVQRAGAFLPFVGFRGKAEVERFSTFTLPGAGIHDDPYLPGRFLPNPLPDYLLSLPFYVPLDIWRELRNARDAARQSYLAAVERRNYFVTRLVAEIAENYYSLMAYDQRLDNLETIIKLQQQSLRTAEIRMFGTRGTALPVQRFRAEIRKNQSQILIVRQDIIQTENRINFLVNRYPQQVERMSARFFNQTFPLSAGVPAQLLQYRPDIRQAERELAAAGLDIKVARAKFFPKLDITGAVGYEAFNPKYLFWPDSLVANVAGDLVVPLVNKTAIRAEYLSANAKQLESVYNYQRVILNAFTEVVNRFSKVENYGRSLQLKRQQVEALVAAVDAATKLFMNPRLGDKDRVDYLDVLTAQRDLWDARLELIDTRLQQLSAVVNGYQALGGGLFLSNHPPDHPPGHPPAPPPGNQTGEVEGELPMPKVLPRPKLLPPTAPPNEKAAVLSIEQNPAAATARLP